MSLDGVTLAQRCFCRVWRRDGMKEERRERVRQGERERKRQRERETDVKGKQTA